MHPTEGRPAAEVVMTVLHAGGKFDKDSYKVSGGLHGVGVSAVNALSDWLKLEIHRDGKVYYQEYAAAFPTTPLEQSGVDQEAGTKVTFHPDPTIFKNVLEFQLRHARQRLRELAFLNSGLRITSTTSAATSGRTSSSRAASPRSSDMNTNKSGDQPRSDLVLRQQGRHHVEVAMQWNDSYNEQSTSASPTRSRTATAAPT
jgi:DNA gyrase subunit B